MRKELCNALSLIVTNEKKRLEDERERVRASLASTPPRYKTILSGLLQDSNPDLRTD